MDVLREDSGEHGRRAPTAATVRRSPPLGRRTIAGIVVATVFSGVVVLLVGLFLLRMVMQVVFATEGDVPDASSMDLPVGSSVTASETSCGSGGCWTVFTVRPPDGTSPTELARQIEDEHGDGIPGDLLDPRTIQVSTEVRASDVEVRGSFW
jgi:hypothetical protein